MRPGSASLLIGVALLALAMPSWAVDPIKLGLFLELTGANAEQGRETLRGANLARDEINRTGGVLGRPIQIVSEDNQSTNPGSEVAVARLLADKDIKGLLGPVRSTQVVTIMPAVANAKIPTVVGGSQTAITRSDNPWIFRARVHDGLTAKALADFGANTLKKRRWGIVHSADGFGIDGKNSVVEELAKFAIVPVAVYPTATNSQNFAPTILALKRALIDVLVMYISIGADVAELAKQLRQAGIDCVLLGPSSVGSSDTVRLGGLALHGSYWVAQHYAGANPLWSVFEAKYRQQYKDDATTNAGWAYDAVLVMAQGFRNGGAPDADSVRKGILAIRGLKGAIGTYNFDQYGDGTHDLHIQRNDNGKRAFVSTFSYSGQ